MKRVVVVGDGRKEIVVEGLREHRPWLEERVQLLEVDLNGNRDLAHLDADLILVFGGDGTILATARRLGGNPVPVLGVNFGKFGFLAEVPVEEFRAVFDRVVRQPLASSRRMLLACEVHRDGAKAGSFLAMNDAVVTRGTISRMVHLSLWIDGKEVAAYGGDGLIIATPVGSTAHSLSAGGPIVHPDLAAFIVTPLCAHTLSLRPLVVAAASELVVEVRKKPEETVLTIDGQVFLYLHEGDRIRMTKAANDLLLVDTGRRTYYETLREKLNWGFSSVHM